MIEVKGGDRHTLTSKELEVLDSEVIPTARRWLRERPQLAQHAIKTLIYWGEPLVDDCGNPYAPASYRGRAE